MTKTIVIGQKPENVYKKAIVFESYISNIGNAQIIKSVVQIMPKDYNFIELICKHYTDKQDLMFAYDDTNKRNNGTLYFGQWNDGLVEP